MKIYRKGNTYWLVPSVIEGKKKAGIKFYKGKFAMNEYWDLDKSATEVGPHEYMFDNHKSTNIIWCIHRSMRNLVNNQQYQGYHTKTATLFVIYEFERTFEDILRKFKAEFLTIKEEANENL